MSNAVELYNQGVTHLQSENKQLAKEAFAAAIDAEPEFAEAYNARAVVSALDGHYKDAISDVDEAIRLDPQDGRFYRTRGLIYREIGDEDQANQDLARSDALNEESE
jgi:Flp pilus assembly protein TadD